MIENDRTDLQLCLSNSNQELREKFNKTDVFTIDGLSLLTIDELNKLKNFMGGNNYGNDNELKANVRDWFNNSAATEHAEGIGKLVKRYDKCLNLNGD